MPSHWKAASRKSRAEQLGHFLWICGLGGSCGRTDALERTVFALFIGQRVQACLFCTGASAQALSQDRAPDSSHLGTGLWCQPEGEELAQIEMEKQNNRPQNTEKYIEMD